MALEMLSSMSGLQTPQTSGSPSLANSVPKMHLSLSQKPLAENLQLRNSVNSAVTKAPQELEVAEENSSTRGPTSGERWERASIQELEFELEQLRTRVNRRI